MKVFITGLGSDLGTQIARVLETRDEVQEIAGVDMFPPRRYLHKSKFYMNHYNDSEGITDIINHFEPDIIVNFGVYEPGSRLSLEKAKVATRENVSGIVYALKKRPNMHIITRSSVVVYGFSNAEKTYDETSLCSPDTPYGELCRDIEENLMESSKYLTIIRTAPEIGSHVPHPLARILTLPVILYQLRNPFSPDIGFPVIAPSDVVELFVRAILHKKEKGTRIFHGATSTNGTTMMAIKEGKKVPLIAAGIGFSFAKQLAYLLGAPVDDHIEALLRKGLSIDSTTTRMLLKITSQSSAKEVIRDLYLGEEKDIYSTLGWEMKL